MRRSGSSRMAAKGVVSMFDLHAMAARERSNDLLVEAERIRRGASVSSADRARFRDGRRVVGRALIRAGEALQSDPR